MNAEEKIVLIALAALVALCVLVARGVLRGSRGISRAVRRRKIAAKHDAIIARFREDCIALGIEVD